MHQSGDWCGDSRALPGSSLEDDCGTPGGKSAPSGLHRSSPFSRTFDRKLLWANSQPTSQPPTHQPSSKEVTCSLPALTLGFSTQGGSSSASPLHSADRQAVIRFRRPVTKRLLVMRDPGSRGAVGGWRPGEKPLVFFCMVVHWGSQMKVSGYKWIEFKVAGFCSVGRRSKRGSKAS